MRSLAAALSAALLLVAASAGCGKSKPKAAEIKDVVQVVVDEDGFKPDEIPAKRGKALTLIFTRKTDKTCATEVVMTSERIRQDLPLDKPVTITFIPTKAGDISFACAMNMIKGTIKVKN